MFARISNSWELVKASWAVLRADKELVVFPIVSMIGVIIVTIAFAVPMLATGIIQSLAESADSAAPESASAVLGLVVLFLFYLVMYFVIIFCNSALVGAAMIRLKGGDPTLNDGFSAALEHVGSILGYALISATVGMILRAISERGGILRQIAASIIGLAWNVVTFLVVPVLVVEGIGPWEAVKRSGGLLRQTWGEQIAGNFSIGMIFGLLAFVALLVGVPLVVVAASLNSVALVVVAVLLLVVVVIGLALVGSTVNGIYAAAVYCYAVDGEASTFFSEDLVQGAFRQK